LVQEEQAEQAEQQALAVPPRAEQFDGWPDAPLLLRAAPLPDQRILDGKPAALRVNDGRRGAIHECCHPCRVWHHASANDVCETLVRRRIQFETDLFRGCAVVSVLGVPSAPARLFQGQRRKTAVTVQGRFKRGVSAEDLVTGQEFARQPRNLPAKWLVETVLVRVSAVAAAECFIAA
jgi:hypothetical protein